MKFTLNSLFVLTTATAVLVALASVAIRISLGGDRGFAELTAAAAAGGMTCALAGIVIGVVHARMNFGPLAAAGIALLVGATLGAGSISARAFASSVAGYCVVGAAVIVLLSIAMRWWSKSGNDDTFLDHLERYERRHEVVLAHLIDEAPQHSIAAAAKPPP